MSEFSDPGVVIRRIEDYVNDLAMRQNPYEAAVGRLVKAEAWWKKTVQLTLLAAEGRNKEEREARAETTAIAANPDIYETLIELRSEVAATKAVLNLIDTSTSALQSILRAQTREAYSRPGNLAA